MIIIIIIIIIIFIFFFFLSSLHHPVAFTVHFQPTVYFVLFVVLWKVVEEAIYQQICAVDDACTMPRGTADTNELGLQ